VIRMRTNRPKDVLLSGGISGASRAETWGGDSALELIRSILAK
jgi:hypothetical protein